VFIAPRGKRDAERTHECQRVSWSEALLALVVSHVVGDVLLQTEPQARAKGYGFGNAEGRRALSGHIATYMLAFIPALVWIAVETSVLRAVVVAALVAITHLVIDDGRLVGNWLHTVKRSVVPAPALSIAVDQSFHVLCLLGAALVAAS
jgi:Protein of unknown function (DUF3307)